MEYDYSEGLILQSIYGGFKDKKKQAARDTCSFPIYSKQNVGTLIIM